MQQYPLATLSQTLKGKGSVVSAWIGTPAPAVVEALLQGGFDSVVLDMQHGQYDETSAATGIAAAALVGKPAIVRIPVDAFPSASRLLDAGAAAIIAPMVNTAEDARRFAAYCKYPPAGERSWGPGRATSFTGLAGQDYLAAANGVQLCMAMIETGAALEALDDILAVPGIDGVFVGPSDLSIALSAGAALDPFAASVDAALDRVAAGAAAAGKIAGLFCFSGAQARAMVGRGFGLVTIATDLMLLRQAAALETAAARN